jgi:hypothetical protein
MADDGVARTKQQGLRQAASVIFALAAIVPLLIFAWTLHTAGAIRSTQAQVSLGLALAVALLGLWMFRSMLNRMAEVVQALAAAVEQGSRPRRAPATVATTAIATGAGSAAPGWFDAGAATPRPAPAVAAAASRRAVSRPPRTSPAVAGIGSIRELTDVVRAMDALWRREATAHLGKRVRISVANSPEPLTGTLSEVSAEGLILEQADNATPVAYARVTGIDRVS